jgi:hypothetical protein
MPSKLNQIIAIEKGVKSRATAAVNENYKLIQKGELFNGFDKKYQPKDEDGDKLPNESKFVQNQGQSVLAQTRKAVTELYEVTARKDWTNMAAAADVKIDGVVILPAVPVTFLLFLEKNLTDLRTFVSHLPVLDAAESWDLDPNSGLYRTSAVSTSRTKKIQTPLVLYPATDKHPAQTQIVTEDVIAGMWNTVKLSGALPRPDVVSYLDKVEKLLKAVKEAREEANMTPEVVSPDVGAAVFGWIFG